MERLDLSTFSKEIKRAYDDVVNGDKSYAVFTTQKDSSLKPTAIGDGDITDFVSEFEEGAVQFGTISVSPFGSDVKKIVLVGFCPDSAPLKSKVSFASNFSDVGKVLHYHVDITARDFDDLDVDDILSTVSKASGAHYSIQALEKPKSSGFKPKAKPASPAKTVPPPAKSSVSKAAPPKPASKPSTTDEWDGEKEVEVRDFNEKPLDTVPSAYKPTKVDINALRSGKSDTTKTPKAVPVKPVPVKAVPAKPTPAAKPTPTSPKADLGTVSLSLEGGLTELPKPKTSKSVLSRYGQEVKTPEFTAKAPTFGYTPKPKTNTPGGMKNFATENGLTPAQAWAAKKGKYKEVTHDDKPVNAAEVEETTESVSKLSVEPKEEKPEERAAFPPPPKREVETKPEPVEPEPVEPEPVAEPEPVEPVAPAASTKKAVAEYDYEKDEDNEISFSEGDVITAIKQVDEDWWFGTNPKGESGLFPSSYVGNVEEETESTPAAPARPSAPAAVAESKPAGPSATAEYDYEAAEANELTFKEGDVISDIDKVDEDWWMGSLKGNRALFPSNYVTLNE